MEATIQRSKDLNRIQRALQQLQKLTPSDIAKLNTQQNLIQLRLKRLQYYNQKKNKINQAQRQLQQYNQQMLQNDNSSGEQKINSQAHNQSQFNMQGVKWSIFKEVPVLSSRREQKNYQEQINKKVEGWREMFRQEHLKATEEQNKEKQMFSTVISKQKGPLNSQKQHINITYPLFPHLNVFSKNKNHSQPPIDKQKNQVQVPSKKISLFSNKISEVSHQHSSQQNKPNPIQNSPIKNTESQASLAYKQQNKNIGFVPGQFKIQNSSSLFSRTLQAPEILPPQPIKPNKGLFSEYNPLASLKSPPTLIFNNNNSNNTNNNDNAKFSLFNNSAANNQNTSKPQTSIFSRTLNQVQIEPPRPIKPASGLFSQANPWTGNQPKTNPNPNLFNNSQPKTNPNPNLFNNSPAQPIKNTNLFSNNPTLPAKNISLFNNNPIQPNQPNKISLFNTNSNQAPKNPLFTNISNQPPKNASLFGKSANEPSKNINIFNNTAHQPKNINTDNSANNAAPINIFTRNPLNFNNSQKQPIKIPELSIFGNPHQPNTIKTSQPTPLNNQKKNSFNNIFTNNNTITTQQQQTTKADSANTSIFGTQLKPTNIFGLPLTNPSTANNEPKKLDGPNIFSNAGFHKQHQQQSQEVPQKKEKGFFTKLLEKSNSNNLIKKSQPLPSTEIKSQEPSQTAKPLFLNLIPVQNNTAENKAKEQPKKQEVVQQSSQKLSIFKKKPNQLFGDFIKSKPQNMFAKNQKQVSGSGGLGIFDKSSEGGGIFGKLNTTNNIFLSKQTNTGIFAFSNPEKQKQEDSNEQDGDQDQILEDKEEIDPTKSTGNYKYEQSTILYRQTAPKFKKGSQNIIENVIISIQKFTGNNYHTLAVRFANKCLYFSGTILPGVTQVAKINQNQYRNIRVKIMCVGEDKKPAKQLLKIQFKDEKQGELFYKKMLQANAK